MWGVTVAWSHHSCTMRGCNHTYKWAKHTCKRSCSSFQEKGAFVSLLFFCFWHSDAGRTLTLNRFFLSTCSNSHAWLSLIFMSWAYVHIIIIIITVMHFGRGETTLDLEEGRPITAAVIRLVWSMIYAESNLPEVTDLDNFLIKARHICWCFTCLCAWLAEENVCLSCVCIGRHQISFLIANNFLIVKILVFSSVDVCLCQP